MGNRDKRGREKRKPKQKAIKSVMPARPVLEHRPTPPVQQDPSPVTTKVP